MSAYDPEAPVQSAVRAIKRELPNILVVTDVCLCEYTGHGHCGIIVGDARDLGGPVKHGRAFAKIRLVADERHICAGGICR